MSINFNIPNRIKPKLLREQKTEALLVFIRTTLEQHFKKIDNKQEMILFGSQEDTEHIYKVLKHLLNNLKETVVNSSYLMSVIENSGKSQLFHLIAEKEKPMMIYYDSIIKSVEKNLPQGSQWIPELLVISLLSNWILEEERSTYLYPFLNDLNYLELIEIFDQAKLKESQEKKVVAMNMYNLSVELINALKNSSIKKSPIHKTTAKKRKRRK